MLPAPPAQVHPLPAPAAPGRELAFPGFNQFPLKATLLAAESRWFAVMVADSGALDRDWHGPRLASHGGRDLALWLQRQGIGSLRYDKRLVGSRDPHLDSSLDAQVGDLKAAIAALKALPEARGRKILLVGHGEGALLSLLAAMDADALLLLAMPSQSMAKTIADQVRNQLPADQAGPNLAHLEASFRAIRAGLPAPAPAAGSGVLPALARLCTSLMAPETLDFVKSTLDLDPWAMAGRTAVPTATVWGDRDVMAWKPAQVPAGFTGACLEIPGANHLFKHEPRARVELNPVSALQGYGDEVALADLTPIADWLKRLN